MSIVDDHLVDLCEVDGISSWHAVTPSDRALIRQRPKPGTKEAAESAGRNLAERKAATKLKRPRVVILVEARKLWGRSLTAERDQRVQDHVDQQRAQGRVEYASPTARTLQALRGRVTRQLYDELRSALSKKPRP